MKELNLVVRKPRRFVATTDSGHALPVAPNLLNREYQVDAVVGLNRAWAGDITYIPTAQGWLYVALVLDLKSRKVIGWSMRDSWTDVGARSVGHGFGTAVICSGVQPVAFS